MPSPGQVREIVSLRIDRSLWNGAGSGAGASSGLVAVSGRKPLFIVARWYVRDTVSLPVLTLEMHISIVVSDFVRVRKNLIKLEVANCVTFPSGIVCQSSSAFAVVDR